MTSVALVHSGGCALSQRKTGPGATMLMAETEKRQTPPAIQILANDPCPRLERKRQTR